MRTSPTGDAGGAAGFTLMELLVSLAVLGLVLALVPGLLPDSRSSANVETVARGIEAGLRLARSEAMSDNRPVGFVLDMVARSYGIEGGPWRPVPDGIVVETVTAQAETLGKGAIGIRFNPNGSSTGGRITVTDGVRHHRVSVDWLTGRISAVP
ncbi:GspH/FimT family pseudopilin [Arenibaculum sp.]|uniref:GspH/FimT family pseudopilin n=1 Tax=Arenibaculum sp. TaxID=2865862 RepID=UPI002E14ABBA|nr:GspH/FimT family pseudopilin [Arenibaculum sp.]